MKGWEIDHFMEILKNAYKGKTEELNHFLSNYSLAKVSKDHSELLILRKFRVRFQENERVVLNAEPDNEHFHWGLTIVKTSEGSTSQCNIYLPNKFSYTNISLKGKILLIEAAEIQKITNTIELFRKLGQFHLKFSETDLEAAFESLNNQRYRKPKALKPLYQTITSSILGTLTFDEAYDWYSSETPQNRLPFNLSIHLASPKKLERLIAFAEKQMQAKFYESALLAMETEMVELKNESWLDEDEVPISIEKFRDAVKIESIVFREDCSCEIFCDDGDLFDGHCILISIDSKGKYNSVTLEG
jgi:hypothetical protein